MEYTITEAVDIHFIAINNEYVIITIKLQVQNKLSDFDINKLMIQIA